ncbi:4-hydroxyproline epimerase [Pseudogemmobacter faecipullorum]|uniref:4-hydroxyproline epimerase n=1 Tax=Pseudogemmobacter faecipullorum TaxID=2755041 RepID=A0ABS8CJD0_9RHOB|nr:4-hydroxyproline epimerase [Pseudogemmobacter faecipullorum]MCB5409480.1 4-hydroxyproline epimerase [Pseudogemmobacter faecipullorum]
MSNHTFSCLDGHTCGNPVRLVSGGGPRLAGQDMLERRAHFLRDFDWIRTGLMFEPRGHDMMSGSILYPPTRPDCDVAVLFIETSGCLPMCGHGLIGTITMGIENGLIQPREPGKIAVDAPAGRVDVTYRQEGRFVEEVRLTNVPGFLYAEGLTAEVEGLGEIVVDVAYGGNFYAIVEPQKNFRDMADFTAGELIGFSPKLRKALNEKYEFIHPGDARINGLSHILWTGQPTVEGAHGRNAVFYGDKAIDRSPCGTGTSARMAQLAAKGKLQVGDEFWHESIIGSIFKGRVEASSDAVPGKSAIIPSIGGWARQTGINTIYIDSRDPYAHGFVVK